MNQDPPVVIVLAGLVIVVVVFELLRRRYVRGRYLTLWLALALVTVFLALCPGVVRGLTSLLGFTLPSNLVLFGLGFFLLVVIMQITAELGRLEERTRVLAEEVGLLRMELRGRDAHLTRLPTGGRSTATPLKDLRDVT